jgi:hypothetical protein
MRQDSGGPPRRPVWKTPRAGSASPEGTVGEVGLRKHRPCPPTLETFGVHTVSVSQEDPSLHEH